MKNKINVLDLVRERVSAEYRTTMADTNNEGMSIFDFNRYENLKEYMIKSFGNKKVAYVLNTYKGNLLYHLFEEYKNSVVQNSSLDFEDLVDNVALKLCA